MTSAVAPVPVRITSVSRRTGAGLDSTYLVHLLYADFIRTPDVLQSS